MVRACAVYAVAFPLETFRSTWRSNRATRLPYVETPA